jgi:hypothetical protein
LRWTFAAFERKYTSSQRSKPMTILFVAVVVLALTNVRASHVVGA